MAVIQLFDLLSIIKHFSVWSRYSALAIILIAFFCLKNTGNMLEGYVLPQTSAQQSMFLLLDIVSPICTYCSLLLR